MNALQLTKIQGAEVTITPEAFELKKTALAKSRGVATVADEFSQSIAAEALSGLHAVVKAMEDSRKDVKKPIIALGKSIDKLAADFSTEVEAEKERIAGLLGGYATVLAREAAAAEAKRQAELRAMEEDRLKAAAEEQRVLQEAEAKLAKAKSAKAHEAAQEALQAVRAKAETERLEAESKRNALASVKTEVTKAEGTTTKQVTKFEVIDLAALYLHNPKLVRMEANTSAINGEIAAGITKIPGVRIWNETVVIARS